MRGTLSLNGVMHSRHSYSPVRNLKRLISFSELLLLVKGYDDHLRSNYEFSIA